MNADKRTVTTDALETLGTIIGSDEKRDAIHLAVENVVAGHPLRPGDHIGLRDGKAYIAGVKKVGIVDPFLAAPVNEGERFWLVVYPRQIKSLRHVWEHPDFPTSGETDGIAAADPMAKSKAWLTDYADDVGLSYSAIIDAARKHLATGEYHTIGFDTPDRVYTGKETFWKHYEIVTGEKVEDHDTTFISCAC